MEGGHSCIYGIEVILQKIQINSPNYKDLTKLSLTVMTPEGTQVSFSHLVRQKVVSFYDQSVKMANCQSFVIRVGRFEKTSTDEIPLGSFRVEVNKLRSEGKMRAKLSAAISETDCVVFYEISLFDTQLFEDTRLSEQIVPELENIKATKTEHPNPQMNFLSPGNQNMHGDHDVPYSIQQTPSFVRSARPSETEQELVKTGPIGSRKDEKASSDTLSFIETPIKSKNRIDEPIKFTKIQHTQSLNVRKPTAEQIQRNYQTVQQQKKITPIRQPGGHKLDPILMLQKKVEEIVFLKYVYEENSRISANINENLKKLQNKVQTLEQEKQTKLTKNHDLMQNKGPLGNRLAMFTAFLAGILVSVLFRT